MTKSDNKFRRWMGIVGGLAVGLLLLATVVGQPRGLAVDTAASQSRLLADIQYLASEELEGRGVGTKGLDRAAEHIAQELAEAGLRTDLVEGTPFQKFVVAADAALGTPNELVLEGPTGQRLVLKSGVDFIPLSFGDEGRFSGPIIFAGYGIEAPEHGYDDYADLDVTDKVVLVMRREPQQDNPHSVFDGTEESQHAWLTTKASTAYQHGARAVIFATDPLSLRQQRQTQRQRVERATNHLLRTATDVLSEGGVAGNVAVHESPKVTSALWAWRRAVQAAPHDPDRLMPFGYGGRARSHSIPVLHIKRKVADELLLSSLGTDIESVETTIDMFFKPRSAELEGWRAVGQVSIIRQQTEVKNVIGVLEGSGPRADETILIGAHYDHLGYGGFGSLSLGSEEIHNGADDNASGTAALLELARRLAARPEPLPRRVVFAAFTAEERGLVGSAHYVKSPVVPLEETIAMINLDMVGRLTDDKLMTLGTAKEFGPLLKQLAERHGFQLSRMTLGLSRSDHYSFYTRRIPIVFFFTGAHIDYHRPSDDWQKINVEGLKRIVDMVEDLVVEVAEAEGRPQFVQVQRPDRPSAQGSRPFFGSIPEFGREVDGYAIQGVAPGSPAEQAGLEGGDIIVRLEEHKIGGLEDFDRALRRYQAGQAVSVTVRRDGKEQTFQVTLDPPR